MNIHAELAELNKNRDNYQCRSDILINDVPLNRKNLTVLIAATAVGKSTMTQRILELAKSRVSMLAKQALKRLGHTVWTMVRPTGPRFHTKK